MPNSKITELTAMATVGDSDVFPVVDVSGTPTTKKVTKANMGFEQVKGCTKTVAASGSHYASIQAAVDDIKDASAEKRYTVLVYPGIYPEVVTGKSYVSIVGTDRRSVVVTAAPATSAHGVIELTGCSEATISGLHIIATNAALGLLVDGASTNISITDNVIEAPNWALSIGSSSNVIASFNELIGANPVWWADGCTKCDVSFNDIHWSGQPNACFTPVDAAPGSYDNKFTHNSCRFFDNVPGEVLEVYSVGIQSRGSGNTFAYNDVLVETNQSIAYGIGLYPTYGGINTIIHAAIGTATTTTTGITNPAIPSKLSVVLGGATHTATGNVTINGTDAADQVIQDIITLPGNTNAVNGTKVFKTITSIITAAGINSANTVSVGLEIKPNRIYNNTIRTRFIGGNATDINYINVGTDTSGTTIPNTDISNNDIQFEYTGTPTVNAIYVWDGATSTSTIYVDRRSLNNKSASILESLVVSFACDPYLTNGSGAGISTTLLNVAFGTPAQVGAGFKGIYTNTTPDPDETHLVWSDGTSWYYTAAGTKAS